MSLYSAIALSHNAVFPGNEEYIPRPKFDIPVISIAQYGAFSPIELCLQMLYRPHPYTTIVI